MPKKCTPCLGKALKELLTSLGDPEVDKILDKVPDCPTPTGIQLCGIVKGKRPRTEYQEYISVCMKERAPNGMTFGEAPQHMKTCAAAWRKQKEGADNPGHSPSEEAAPEIPSLVRRLPVFQGKAYRVDIPNLGIPTNATAGDVVRFERDELGNQMGVPGELLEELDKHSYRDVIWVTKNKADAEHYLSEGMTKEDISGINVGQGARIVAEDGEGGFFVLQGGQDA